jgi:hypothetical protein
MIDEVAMDEPMNQPRPARPKAPEVFISQRSKVLRASEEVWITSTLPMSTLGGRVGPMSGHNPCMRLTEPAKGEETR